MKKIIITVKGVLVRLYWKISDALKETMNSIDFIIHHKQNRKEMEDFEKEKLSHQKEREKYKNELIDVHQELDNLSTKYVNKKNKLGEVEKQLHESTLAIQEENHKYLEMKLQYEEASKQKDIKISEIDNYLKLVKRLEKKVNYRNELIDNLRTEKSNLRKTIGELNNELESLKNKMKFIESKLPKKTLEEIVAYTFSQKEVLKRSKKKEQEK
jgi:chromosome segregation ATPase